MKNTVPVLTGKRSPKIIDKGVDFFKGRKAPCIERQAAAALAVKVVPAVIDTGCHVVKEINKRQALRAESRFIARRHREGMEKAREIARYRGDNGESMSQEARDEFDLIYIRMMAGESIS